MIRFENVSFRYDNTEDNAGIENISFSVKKGECVLLCGRSGSGKTTITKLLNGLIPNFEKGKLSGEITINGIDVSKIPQYEISRHVASVFQNPKSQFFNTDAESELSFNLENLSVPTEEIDRRLKNVIVELNLKSLIKKSLFEMSGGEKQLIAFASAYISGAELILLDEPTANLDADAIEKIRSVILKMKQSGKTIIISEHRLSFLREIADTVCYLEGGRLSRIMTADEFYDIPDNKRIALGLRKLDGDDNTFSTKKTEATGKELLRVNSLTVGYKKNIIIENLNFSCCEGEIIGICGRNGIGKTSLLCCLCGLNKQKDGQIYISEKKASAKDRQKNFGIVMQDVNYQLFSDSVERECILGNAEISEDKITSILKILSLINLKERHPQSLSGGQKQRLAIAVAYLCNKKIILLDEPTSGLDYENMQAVSTLLKQLSKHGIACITVSHDTEFLNTCCERILTIE